VRLVEAQQAVERLSLPSAGVWEGIILLSGFFSLMAWRLFAGEISKRTDAPLDIPDMAEVATGLCFTPLEFSCQ